MIPSTSGTRWYVIRTKPKNEKISHSYLRQQGINTFLPLMETAQVISGSSMKLLKPLFPGYLFAQFDLMENYPLVKWGKGVHSILGFGKYPTPLADEAIAVIKTRTDENAVVKQAYSLNKNDHIKITSGPLKDLLGIFDRWVSDSGRVRILLNLIGYQPGVELHYSQVAKISA